MFRTRLKRGLTVQQFMIGPKPVFLDESAKVVETEEGQAVTNGVLMAQTGSLVYYVSIVNDVFAYFRTGVVVDKIPPNPFCAPLPQPKFEEGTAWNPGCPR
jgi:hypothetical protein